MMEPSDDLCEPSRQEGLSQQDESHQGGCYVDDEVGRQYVAFEQGKQLLHEHQPLCPVGRP